MDLAAYIVQEALTNAHRYGDGSARLDISYTSGDIELEVSNRIPVHSETGPGSGYGLLGMRERATAAGGSVTATLSARTRSGCARCCPRTRSCAFRRGRHDDRGAARDDGADRAGFKMIIDSEPGFEVVAEAGDGREAVDLARTARADVVLVDIRMPRMDGLEPTRRIGADDNLAGVRVLGPHQFESGGTWSWPSGGRQRVPRQGRRPPTCYARSGSSRVASRCCRPRPPAAW